METGNFTDNIVDRSEAVQNIHFFVQQGGVAKKGSAASLDSTKELFVKYLESSLAQEDIPLVAFSKSSYNVLMERTFKEFNKDNPEVKRLLQKKVDLMVDEYAAKNMGADSNNQNLVLTLAQLAAEVVQRRSGIHDHLFTIFFPRLLNDDIRQVVWRAALVRFML